MEYKVSKSRKFLIAVLPLFIIFGGGLVVIFSLDNKSDQQLVSETDHVIELRDNGFYPEKITIRQGDIVTFKTSRNTYFWPASNLHPTHTFYPEFDPKDPVRPEDEWSFRFDKIGIWEFHDHIDPNASGVIYVINKDSVVISDGQDSKNVKIKCSEDWTRNTEKQLRCWDDLFRLMVPKKGVNASLEYFDTLYERNPLFRVHCHRQAHVMGEETYWQLKNNKNFTLTDTTSLCGYGFYHGFMQEFVSHNRDIGDADTFCKNIEKALSVTDQCYHGIGHGLVYLHAAETWGNTQEIANKSLTDCEKITPAKFLNDCLYGVYGGIESFYWGLHSYTLDINKESPFLLCKNQSTFKRVEFCYNALLPVLYGFTGREETIQTIQNISEDELAFVLMDHLGYVIYKYETEIDQTDFSEFITLCQSLSPRLNKSCIGGFVKGFVQLKRPRSVSDRALNFCESALLSREEKDICIDGVFDALAYFYPTEKAKEVCRTVRAEYKDNCYRKVKSI